MKAQRSLDLCNGCGWPTGNGELCAVCRSKLAQLMGTRRAAVCEDCDGAGEVEKFEGRMLCLECRKGYMILQRLFSSREPRASHPQQVVIEVEDAPAQQLSKGEEMLGLTVIVMVVIAWLIALAQAAVWFVGWVELEVRR